jgi:protein-disulfide isomerase
MKIILDQYVMDGKVNFVYKDFPLNGAPSIMASEASYCAQEQGKFWEYHDLIYENWEGENTGWLTRNALDRFANEVKLNQSEFNSCMNDSKYRQKVLEIEQFAREIDVDATPSFIIFDDTNAYRIIGAQPFEKFEQVLDELR